MCRQCGVGFQSHSIRPCLDSEAQSRKSAHFARDHSLFRYFVVRVAIRVVEMKVAGRRGWRDERPPVKATGKGGYVMLFACAVGFCFVLWRKV